MSNIFDILQRMGLRVSLCTLALTVCTVAFAQEDFEDEEVTVKVPKRKTVVDKNPTIEISGSVVDQITKRPVAGVRIQMLGDNRYTAMTNAEGAFKVKIPTFATALYVTAPRYLAQQVAITSNDAAQKVNIELLSNEFSEMYTDDTEITATNSFSPSGRGITVDEEITGKLGGDMRSIMHSGNLDQGAAMFIRGLSSINANAQPLVIVDGVELDMQRNRSSLHEGDIFNMLSTISPDDIDKVEVVKNATALYGARGSNGVILITTKRGHSMATRIDVKVSAGITARPSTPTMMSAPQFRTYAAEQLGNVSEVAAYRQTYGQSMFFNFLDDNKAGYYYQTYHNDTDWQDYVYKTGITQNYGINVQGGDDVGMYNLSVGYVQDLKNVRRTQFNRINVRFNTDINLLDRLSTKFNVSFSKTNNSLLDDGVPEDLNAGTITSPTFLAQIKSPLLYPYQYNSNIGGFTSLFADADDIFYYRDATRNYTYGENNSLGNPLALIQNASGERKNRNENTFFNISVEPTYEIMTGLKVTSLFSYYLNRNSQAYYRPNIGLPPFTISGLGTVYSKTASIFAKETNILSNTHVDWTKKYGVHDVAVTAGFRYNYFSYDGSDLSSEYAIKNTDDKNPQLQVGDSYYSNISGVNDVWKNMQWYASGDYNYMNRYFATVSILAEGNSRFGKSTKTGGMKFLGVRCAIFPSIQLGWVMTNEDWFPKTNTINYLKVTAGFDISGNDDISNYATMNSFTSVRFNNSEIGMQLTNVGNDQVKWETTQKWNFGVKANMLKNRLSAGIDFYIHKTFDLLALKTFTNPIAGINKYWVNDGSLKNTGFELSLSGKPIVKKDWKLEVGATIGHYKNKVTKLTDGDYTTSIYGDNNILTAVGHSVGEFYGYQTRDHVFSTSAEAASAGKLHTNINGEQTTNLYYVDAAGNNVDFEAGDVWFVDQNGDGKIDEQDKVVIGNPNPDIYGNIFASLKWKRFSFNMGFNYSIGNDVYNYHRSVLNSGSTLYNQQVAEVGRWRYEGQITALPKAMYGDPKGNNRFSDRWIENGSYLRLKTLTISYDIPVPESWQSWLQGLSVWGEARNLFTITKYTGNDPEFSISNNQLYQGIDRGNVSMGRAFALGLKVNL